METFLAILGCIIGLAIYFLPTIIAWNKPFVLPVFLVNLILGWTIIGWIILLSVACINIEKKQTYVQADTKTNYQDVYTALEKLSNLHKNGIITDAEFAEQKRK